MIVATLEKNMAKMRAVDIPRYKVCMRCHMIFVVLSVCPAKVGKIAIKNYIYTKT